MTGQASPGGGAGGPGPGPGPGTGTGTGPGPEQPRKKGIEINIWQMATIALAAFAIAAVIGYFVGDDEGESSGKQEGQSEVAARYEPGGPGYKRIYAEGRKAGHQAGLAAGKKQGEAEGKKQGESEGKKVGFEEGKTAGVKTGEAEGVSRGATAALGGLTDWQSGSFYVVRAGDGNGVPTTISERHLMSQGFEYELCDSDPDSLCRVPKQAR